ncbi:MAG TPA: LacI family DNA-binding transcriptional regulator [Amaricoccus sp.]|nr:LacI family DNA-binding transcriptional regulator [Amaricoccus sp.]
MSRLTGRNARLSDVAEAAGVSKATASNVFNRPELVRKEVRLRVQEVAKRIGYAGPDPKGRLLSAGRVNAIGVATGEPLAYFFDDPYARTMMRGIAEVCDANGIGVSLISATEDEVAWSIRTALVDGLILFCLEGADRLVASSRARRLPFVALDLGEGDVSIPAVGIDDVAGARLAARHLVELGHRRFAVLAMEFAEDGASGPADPLRVAAATYAPSRDRVTGAFEVLIAAGIDTATVPILETTSDPATVTAALAALFAAPAPPTALLAQSDRIAMTALDWLAARGIAVPHDVSIVGFDGVPESAATIPPLTTVRQPIAEIGRRAVEILLDPSDAVRRETLATELVVRASTAAPPED